MQRPELLAGFVVFVLGAPLVYMFASAIADGEVRRHEAPLRAMLGDTTYQALVDGRRTDYHYLGDDRLAPDFTLQDRDGRPWTLSEHRGRTVVMNFWSVTCQPCVEEMPSLEHLARVVRQRDGIDLIAVSTDRRWQDVETIVAARSPLRVLLDPDRTISRDRFGTRLLPETWIIDGDGVIRMRIDGPRDWASGVALDAIEAF